MFRQVLFFNFRIVHTLTDWVRYRFTPGGLLILSCLVVAGVFGVDIKRTLAFQLFSITVALIVFSILVSFYFRDQFQIRRILPDFGSVGSALHYSVLINNNNDHVNRELILFDEMENRFPTFEEYRHAYDPADRLRNWFDRKMGYPRLMALMKAKRGASIEPILIENIAKQDKVECAVKLLPLRRGYIRFSRFIVGKPDPLGVFRATQVIAAKDALLILPKTYDVPPLRLQGKRDYQHSGINQAGSVGSSQEFLSLREYRPGDPFRAIHWRSFAKLGKPVVKEFQDEFFARQGLLLDTFLQERPKAVFEEAVSIAASYATDAVDEGALLDLLFVSTEPHRIMTQTGIKKPEHILEILACVEPCHGQSFSTLHNLVQQACAEISGLICIFLAWDEQRQALVQSVLSLDVSVQVFVIASEADGTQLEPAPPGMAPERFTVLHVEHIQAQLNQLIP